MEITGTIVLVTPVTTGGSGAKPWCKQDFVIETDGKYPKKVCITLWGQDNIDKYDLAIGSTITASIEIESREYNGKWFTNVKAWKIEGMASVPQRERQPEPKPTSGTWPDKPNVDGTTDDLPF
jgi:hypothetical protein